MLIRFGSSTAPPKKITYEVVTKDESGKIISREKKVFYLQVVRTVNKKENRLIYEYFCSIDNNFPKKLIKLFFGVDVEVV